MGTLLIPVLLLMLAPRGLGANFRDKLDGRCERITIPMCVDMRYNLTRMPNLIGHQDQDSAAIQVHEFYPLVEIGCSPLLKFFLCSLYAPMCTEQVEEMLIIPPCRSMCHSVRSDCEPILMRFDFKWPSILDCSKLPERPDKSNLCMEEPKLEDGEQPGYMPPEAGDGFTQNAELLDLLMALRGKSTSSVSTTPRPQCSSQRYVYVDKLSREDKCAPACGVEVLFRTADKNFAEIWMIVWSVLCFVSTTMTVTTFLVDTDRFKYPERPIIFLSMCYSVYALAYMVRAIRGPVGIACDQNQYGKEFLIQGGLESTWCIIVFLVLYFFGMASSIWWVILTLTWYLAAGRKWGREAIQAMSSYFHLAAWAIPAIQTIVILTMRRVDGDELTGLCYVGNADTSALIGFVLVPLIVYLLVGTLFILAGFVAMFRIRNDLKNDGANIRKLEKLMAKIGVFSVLYTVPATCVIGCHMYEHLNRAEWHEHARASECPVITTGPQVGKRDCTLNQSIPTVEVYMLKIFMNLVVGITCGMWIWSSKTVQSWSGFCSRTLGGRRDVRKTGAPAAHQYPPASATTQHKPIYYQKCASSGSKVLNTPASQV